MLGLAVMLAISALINLALLISEQTRKTLLSSVRWLINKVRGLRANPTTSQSLPGPSVEEADPIPVPAPTQGPTAAARVVLPSKCNFKINLIKKVERVVTKNCSVFNFFER